MKIILSWGQTLKLAGMEWKRKTELEKTIQPLFGHKVRRQTRVNIGVAFQGWQELRELKGLKSDAASTNNSNVRCLRSLW